ncbi:helix-turn-helix transcriptional regulator [Mucilaginibacter sp. BJC16-A38]|uniref:helix-turn-helix transcriptional regulator n=1 Tax=Mucilaginibacter phenanthrenivorans TaxID=1234842 RepID=UPI0021572401|nr:helix-turn-helix transcriptional regulator [Mucilaginibacter phenanthrenivorans]MCR8558370.1 helix-turn-helix transcriptional regulator [Mucilaginibacter phenanthrenivorans]
MEFKQFFPSDILKPYVRHYYIFESDSDIEFEDTVFPSGDMELIFNLGSGTWESSVENKYLKTPGIELWGQVTKPLPIRSKGKHTMLGVKFFPHSAAYFLNDEIGLFNDQISNAADVIGEPVNTLYARLLETLNPGNRIALLEAFLIKQLKENEKRFFRIDKAANILTSIKKDPAENNLNNIALKHGITARYLHKLVYQNTGLSPTAFNKINRFQFSLKLISKNDLSLTSIAYESGYFDQSHFIRDFKLFTGFTPSAYLHNITPVNQLLQQ